MKPTALSLTYHPATSADTPSLRRLARGSEAVWGYDEVFMERFYREFNITERFIEENPVYVACSGKELVAFWGMRQDGGKWELEYFYIEAGRLGCGYGRQMWGHLTGWCKDRGIGCFHFVTSPQAIGFYEKMGAVRDGERESVIDGRAIPHFTCLV